MCREIQPRNNGRGLFAVWWVLAALSFPILLGCADDGAGGFTELDGFWNGTFQEGGIPLGLTLQPMAHSSTGDMSLDISTDDEGNITGTATMTPDICATGAQTSLTEIRPITGTVTGNAATFQYTSTLVTPNEDVEFTVQSIIDPMTGFYDGSNCSASAATWTGGFKVTKKP